jgi:hypothetical protein
MADSLPLIPVDQQATNLILPGAANITTAAGDIAVMYEYASADWRCVSYTKASGAAVVAGGGAWNIVGTSVASASASLTITGLDSTYDTYAIGISDLVPATNTVILRMRFGDSSGVDSGASDYKWYLDGDSEGGVSIDNRDDSDSEIELNGTTVGIGNGAGFGYGGMIFLHRPGDGTTRPRITGHGIWAAGTTNTANGTIGGERAAVITLDRIQILFSSGNIATGRMTVWGVAHA